MMSAYSIRNFSKLKQKDYIIKLDYLQHSNNSLSSESSLIIEEMNKTIPYIPEEKKVRIKRHKNKRNQRNFCKKIKGGRGECRRGLAAWAWREVGRKGRLRAVQDLRVREKRWGRGGGGVNEASRAQRTGNCVKIRSGSCMLIYIF
ncbi:hypothetical protein GYH30_043223 [Glycine max]|nr:hypothetical protein GYH30_043223 [Glycine max]